MKVFISADIEGVTNVTHWDETDLGKPEYTASRQQMTAEVAAACESALMAGAKEIWVKDAHWTGRNIIGEKLPHEVKLVRGWSNHPFMMMQELNETFQAAIFIGYHSGVGYDTSPLAHTLNPDIQRFVLNRTASTEFLLNAYTASLHKVPVVFVSGDKGLCDEVSALNPHIGTVAVKEGIGDSTISIHPEVATARIRDAVRASLSKDPAQCLISLPDSFSVELTYRSHSKAFRNSFYPGVARVDPHTIRFETDDYFEVLRFLLFVT